ncbi:MAG: hypothetical protein P1U88_18820 [Thalassobaculaceae bacterium]|nr:hypothetical protein [Thalassobaculaceae bacterium]
MLQPIQSPSVTNPQPNAALIAPRPVQQERQSSATRNLTSNPVRQNAESEATGADSEEDHNERVSGERAVRGFTGGGRRGERGEYLDIYV